MRYWLLAMITIAATAVGCGTTRWSDTARTATEQLLLSDAADRAVSQIDFNVLADSRIFIDTSPIRQTTDSAYLTSSIRQQLLACGCTIKERAEDADYVLEVRAGAMGTDRRDLLIGVPATSVPSVGVTGTGPQIIPEIPIMKRTEQRAVAKIAVFAYDRETGRPIWQSGTTPVESKARDFWVLGAGPFQRGNIYNGTKFAGQTLPSIDVSKDTTRHNLSVTQEVIFTDSEELLADKRKERQAMQNSPPGMKGPLAAPGMPGLPVTGGSSANGVTQAGLTELQRTPPVQPKPQSPPSPQPQAVPPVQALPPVPATPQAVESMSPPQFQTATPLPWPGSGTNDSSAAAGPFQIPSLRVPFLTK